MTHGLQLGILRLGKLFQTAPVLTQRREGRQDGGCGRSGAGPISKKSAWIIDALAFNGLVEVWALGDKHAV